MLLNTTDAPGRGGEPDRPAVAGTIVNMSEPKPPAKVDMVWERDLVFSATSGDVGMTLDSASLAGPSPMQALAFALAACMAMDLVHILTKGRHPLTGLRARLVGQRAAQEPRRFTSIELHYTVTGAVPQDAVQRAIELSRDKYCSVWHSMRQDIPLTVDFTVNEG
jgi:putative redox protein